MGMSASQARLLSITARLTANELSSQLITNSKIRLATKSEAASDEYMAALNKTKLNFVYFNNNGESQTYDLTPQVLYTYSPLKSQYSIQDVNGRNLVSATDAKNFQETNTLADFLACYGLVSQEENKILQDKYEEDLKEYEENLDRYNKDKAQYDLDKEQYDKDKADYDIEKQKYDEEYAKWLEEKGKPSLYDKFSGIVGTSDNPTAFCYDQSLNSGNSGCYIHILAHLLDWEGGDVVSKETYTASNGKTVDFRNSNSYVTGAGMHSTAKANGFVEISEEMDNPNKVCDGDDRYIPAYENGGVEDEVKDNIIQEAIDAGRTPTEVEILNSDYIYDPATNSVVGVKTLKQKAIDLLYLLMNNMMASGDLRSTLINFTDGDMRNLASEPTAPTPPTAPIPPEEPTPPTPPARVAKVNDKEKGQWYVNLWYMMNGSETANLLYEDEDETTNGWYYVAFPEKSPETKQNYRALEEGVVNDPSWLQYALDNGIVSLVKTQYTDPGANSGKVQELTADAITWKSVTYQNTQDIYSAEDELAITKAQAKYEKAVKDIEAKEKKYDTDLKNLDTIHNALQTEYESVKNVIAKNVERSFKAFS